MVTDPLDDWETQAEAAEILKCSQKTIGRRAAQLHRLIPTGSLDRFGSTANALGGIVKLTGFQGNKPPYRVFRRGFIPDILGLFQLVMR